MILDIINPSDACTMVTDDREAGAIACVLLGNGQYGLKQLDAVAGDIPFEVPLFLLGGHDEWWTRTFGHNFEAGALTYRDKKSGALIDALKSVTYQGTPGSLNDIAGRAHGLAKALAADAKAGFGS
jgi:hypothetical protein